MTVDFINHLKLNSTVAQFLFLNLTVIPFFNLLATTSKFIEFPPVNQNKNKHVSLLSIINYLLHFHILRNYIMVLSSSSSSNEDDPHKDNSEMKPEWLNAFNQPSLESPNDSDESSFTNTDPSKTNHDTTLGYQTEASYDSEGYKKKRPSKPTLFTNQNSEKKKKVSHITVICPYVHSCLCTNISVT